MKSDEEAKWQQAYVHHCPSKDCKGMLLQSDFYHEEKCTDCHKYFLFINKDVHEVSERFEKQNHNKVKEK